MITGREKLKCLKETCPVFLRPSQIPYGLHWDQTRTSAMRGWSLKVNTDVIGHETRVDLQLVGTELGPSTPSHF